MSSVLEAFIRQFREIQPKFSRLFTRILNQAGLTQPQYALLLELKYALPRPLTMTEVSRKLFITKPAVTSLVDRLEERKFIRRVAHPEDRRISLLAILPAGKNLVGCMQTRILDLFLQTGKQFSDRELSIIKKFYSSLSHRMDEVLCHKKGCRP